MLVGPTPGDLLLFDQRMTSPVFEESGIGSICAYSDRRPGGISANEDSAAIIFPDHRSVLFVVADGLGAREAGEHASRQAVLCIQTAVTAAAASGGPVHEAVVAGIESANRLIAKMKNGAATTIAAAHVGARGITTYHVGDSRILIVGKCGQRKLQTIDHSRVGEAIKAGLISERQANGHPEGHYLTNAVGLDPMQIEIGSASSLQPNDTLLLATDGLFDSLVSEDLARMIRKMPFEKIASNLRNVVHYRMRNLGACRHYKPDDLTFILFRPKSAPGD